MVAQWLYKTRMQWQNGMSAEECILFSAAEKSNRKVQPRGQRALMVSITPSVFSNLLPLSHNSPADRSVRLNCHTSLSLQRNKIRERLTEKKKKKAPKLYIQQGCKSAFPSVSTDLLPPPARSQSGQYCEETELPPLAQNLSCMLA